jgi:hypothetical protein
MRSRRRAWHRFQTSFRWVGVYTFWRLGFNQSRLCHITRVPQRTVPYVWTRPLISWHAAVPATFRLWVSHWTQELSSKFLPTESGIQQRRLTGAP